MSHGLQQYNPLDLSIPQLYLSLVSFDTCHLCPALRLNIVVNIWVVLEFWVLVEWLSVQGDQILLKKNGFSCSANFFLFGY